MTKKYNPKKDIEKLTNWNEFPHLVVYNLNETMGNKLKPCPFCGCRAKFEIYDFAHSIISCTNPLCKGRIKSVENFDGSPKGRMKWAKVLIKRWNKRA